MDFRSLLQSMTELSESEGSRVHKGTYGTSHGKEDVRDQYGHKVGKIDKEAGAKKDAPKKGRGRPKKGADDSGEVKTYDSSALSNVFGGGKKPSKPVGTVSKKHSLKEYMESVEDTKNAEAVFESIMEGVNHTSVANNLAKLAKVIQSVQTPEQFAVAQKYAQRMSGAIQQHQHAGMGFGSGLRANIGVSRDIQSDLKRKAAELGIDYQPLEETGGDQIEIKPASATNTQVIQQGNKTLGTVNNPQLANTIKQAMGKGEMSLNPDEQINEINPHNYDSDEDYYNDLYGEDDDEEYDGDGEEDEDFGNEDEPESHYEKYVRTRGLGEGKDQGKPGKNFAKIAKSAGEKYGSKAAGERVAGAVKAKLAKQDKLEEAKPDFLDVDKDKNKKESWKKAEKDKAKKKVDESISLAESPETLQHIINKYKHEVKNFINDPSSDMDHDLYEALFDYYFDAGEMPYGTAKGRTGDPFEWIAQRFDQDVHDYVVDESATRDFRIHGVKPTNDFSTPGSGPGKSMAVPRGTPTTINRPVPNPTPFGVDPIAATTDRAINFISGLRKPSNPFSESKTMKDMQVESWATQLNSLLNEGITVSSSQGQQGSPDSVSVTASDADAQALLAVLRQAGIGGFGGGEEQPQVDAYGVMSQGEEEPTGTGTEPQASPDVVGDGDDMLALIKKMSGISSAPVQGGEEGQDYEDEEGDEAGTLEPTDGGEESGSELPGDEEGEEEGSEEDSEEEEQTDEGNAFTGKLKQTPHGGSFNQGGKTYKDTSSIEEGGYDPEQRDGGGAGGGDVKKCSECGGSMTEGHNCGEEQVEENYANDAGGDAMGDAALMKLKALLSVGNDLHKMKTTQAMGNPVRVTESKQMINEWKKLSGI